MTLDFGASRNRALRRPVARDVIGLVLAIPFVFLLAQNARGTPPEDNVTAVRRLEDRLTAAFNAYDAGVLNRLWDDDLTFVFPNGALASKVERLASLKEVPADIPQSTNESVDVKSFRDVAVAIVVSRWPGARDGKPFVMRFRATHVWVRRDREWKLVSAHVSQIKE